MDFESAARKAALVIIAEKMQDNPDLLSAGKQGYSTLKEFLPWADDDQLGDVWMAIVQIVDAAGAVGSMGMGTVSEVIEAIVAGGKISAGYSYARHEGVL